MSSPNPTVILLSHGSPDPRSSMRMNQFAQKLSERLGFPVLSTFLDHNTPLLSDVSPSVTSEITYVQPMLLTHAFHAKFDVPKALKKAGLSNLLPGIGHPQETMISLLKSIGQPAIFVSVGTTDVQAQRDFEESVQSASKSAGVAADWAYVTGNKDLIGEKFKTFSSHGGKFYFPWVFAEGILLDRTIELAKQYSLQPASKPLCDQDEFLAYVAKRLHESIKL